VQLFQFIGPERTGELSANDDGCNKMQKLGVIDSPTSARPSAYSSENAVPSSRLSSDKAGSLRFDRHSHPKAQRPNETSSLISA